MDLGFFSSPIGVAIAWVCTVAGFAFALFQTSKIVKLKQEINSLNFSHNKLKVENNELKVENTNLEQKFISSESNEMRDNFQGVKQAGKNNINQGVVNGDVNLDLS